MSAFCGGSVLWQDQKMLGCGRLYLSICGRSGKAASSFGQKVHQEEEGRKKVTIQLLRILRRNGLQPEDVEVAEVLPERLAMRVKSSGIIFYIKRPLPIKSQTLGK